MARKRGAVGLGRTQRLVLSILASQGPCSARELEYHWPTLTESSAGSALRRLGDRGLVDAAGWNYSNQRTYGLTEQGYEVEAGLNTEYDEDES